MHVDEYSYDGMTIFERFAAAQLDENGNALEWLQVGETRVFANGARVMMPPSSMGFNGRASWTFRQPPFTAEDALRFRLEFLEPKIAHEQELFDRFKSDCGSQAAYHARSPHHCPPPPEDAAEQLRRGAARIFKLQTEADEIKRKLREEFPDSAEALAERRRRENAEAKEARFEEMAALRNEIGSVSRT